MCRTAGFRAVRGPGRDAAGPPPVVTWLSGSSRKKPEDVPPATEPDRTPHDRASTTETSVPSE